MIFRFPKKAAVFLRNLATISLSWQTIIEWVKHLYIFFLYMHCTNYLNINTETKGYSNNIYEDSMVDKLTIRLHPVKPNGLVESNTI